MRGTDTACSGVILAGGRNQRFEGKNKSFLRIGGRRIIDRIYEVFAAVFAEIIIVTNDPGAYLEFDATIVSDVFSVRSSLTGIHSGLFYAANPFIFVAACDIPFLQERLVRLVLEHVEANAGVVIPQTEAGLEPLCAVYAKSCLPVAERCIRNEVFKIRSFFKPLRVVQIPEKTLRRADSELGSFFNINTPADLARAGSWADHQANTSREENR